MASHRLNKISEEIKKSLGALLPELKDPRLDGIIVSVVRVSVTQDLSYATAYISVLGDEKRQRGAIGAIENAAGFIRKEIGKRVRLRHTPEFIFKLDSSIEYGAHINKLLDDIARERDGGQDG